MGARSVCSRVRALNPWECFFIPIGAMCIAAGIICIAAGMIYILWVWSVTTYPWEIPDSDFFTHIIKNKFVPRPEFSCSGDIFTLWAPIFIMVIDVWHCTNLEMVINNLFSVIKVALCEALLFKGD